MFVEFCREEMQSYLMGLAYLRMLLVWYLIISSAAWTSDNLAFVVWGYPEGSSTLAGKRGILMQLIQETGDLSGAL
jgi:hypothetical protein